VQLCAHLVALQQAQEELVRGAGEEGGVLNLLRQDLLLQHGTVLRAEGRAARQHLEQQHTHAPPVSRLRADACVALSAATEAICRKQKRNAAAPLSGRAPR
jgi:hypothetical protein